MLHDKNLPKIPKISFGSPFLANVVGMTHVRLRNMEDNINIWTRNCHTETGLRI